MRATGELNKITRSAGIAKRKQVRTKNVRQFVCAGGGGGAPIFPGWGRRGCANLSGVGAAGVRQFFLGVEVRPRGEGVKNFMNIYVDFFK